MPINPCATNPCRNGGTCKQLELSYLCVCTENWKGRNCTQRETSITNIEYLNSISQPIHLSSPIPPHPTTHSAVIRDQAPEILYGPQDTFQKLYSTVNLTCIATGTPEPSITWYKDGTLLPNQQLPFLLIPELQLQDRGLYHCEASNQIRFENDPDTLHQRMAISREVVVNIEGELPCPWGWLMKSAGDWPALGRPSPCNTWLMDSR